MRQVICPQRYEREVIRKVTRTQGLCQQLPSSPVLRVMGAALQIPWPRL